jgi:hypothetical protein
VVQVVKPRPRSLQVDLDALCSWGPCPHRDRLGTGQLLHAASTHHARATTLLPVFTMLHDAGPVRVGLLVMAWTPIIVTSQHLKAKPVAAEDKPFFVYLVPSIALLSVASLSFKGLLRGAHGSSSMRPA